MFDKHAHYWKSSKVTNGKVGYIATAGNAISMMTRNADNSKFSMRDQAIREYLNIGYAVGTYLRLKRVPAPVSVRGLQGLKIFKVRSGTNMGLEKNVYGRMKQTDELSVFELYYIIALDGGVYNRSRAGDELVDPSVLSTDPISGVVVQNPEKGHQLEG